MMRNRTITVNKWEKNFFFPSKLICHREKFCSAKTKKKKQNTWCEQPNRTFIIIIPIIRTRSVCQRDSNNSNDSVLDRGAINDQRRFTLTAGGNGRAAVPAFAAMPATFLPRLLLVPVLKAAVTAVVPGVKAVVKWHAALSLSGLRGAHTTCHYQLSALAATDS